VSGVSVVEGASEDGLFGRVAIAWGVGSPVVYVAGPAALASVLPVPSDFPVGARLALVAGWITFVLLYVAIINVFRIVNGARQVEFSTPPALFVWLRAAALGIAALQLGFLIATTVFR
jgi:hypothetical protein